MVTSNLKVISMRFFLSILLFISISFAQSNEDSVYYSPIKKYVKIYDKLEFFETCDSSVVYDEVQYFNIIKANRKVVKPTKLTIFENSKTTYFITDTTIINFNKDMFKCDSANKSLHIVNNILTCKN